jgi:glucose dehydrogenase
MTRRLLCLGVGLLAAFGVGGSVVRAQRPVFAPVTAEMLVKPSADDWLMYSRTYDAQRFSPLKQITKQNAGQLKEVFKKDLGTGVFEGIPIVYRGVMYLMTPGAAVQALDATTGALIWEHRRAAGASRVKTVAIYEDMVYYPSPDGYIVALDARTGEVRWETKTTGGMVAGSVVIEGKVLTGRTCAPRRENCYISAHDAKTGVELWRFYTAAGSTEPGGDTWGGAPDETRAASTWGLRPGSPPGLLGRGQPDTQHPSRTARRQLRGDSHAVTRRPLQQLHDRAAPGYRQAGLVLPAPARRRLGRRLPSRAHVDPHGRAAQSRVREVDQP